MNFNLFNNYINNFIYNNPSYKINLDPEYIFLTNKYINKYTNKYTNKIISQYSITLEDLYNNVLLYCDINGLNIYSNIPFINKLNDYLWNLLYNDIITDKNKSKELKAIKI